jgi:bile acid-coenzyme A ligase
MRTRGAPTGLRDRIAAVGAARGNAEGVVVADHTGRTTITWHDFAVDVERFSRRIALHTAPGAVVTVPAELTPAGVVRLIATLASGRTVMPVDPLTPGPERDRLVGEVAHTGAEIADIGTVVDGTTSAPVSAGGADGADGGYLLVTGGSTGLPKLVHHKGSPVYHERAVPSALLRRTGFVAGQTQLLTGPLHHAASFARMIDAVLSGNTMIIPRTFRPELIHELVERFSVGWAQLTPTHMRLLDDCLRRRPEAWRSVTGVLHTAAPCPPDTKRNWIECLGGSRVHEMYTATEAIGTTLCDGNEWLARPGTVGRGFFTRLRIYDGAGRRLPPGAVGEVYMRGISLRGTDDTTRTRDGYRSVGDRGHLDEDGYLFLSGRREDLHVVGGENVYSFEVVSAILAHPDAVDAAVVGMPDELLGTRLVALVVAARADLTPVTVLEHCMRSLSPHKVPAEVKLVGAIPRTPAGKLASGELSRLAAT